MIIIDAMDNKRFDANHSQKMSIANPLDQAEYNKQHKTSDL